MTAGAYTSLGLFIDGRLHDAGDRDVQPVVNPATGDPIGELPLANEADLDEALDAAARGFETWRMTAPDTRAVTMRKAASLLRERASAIAGLLTAENGKPLGEAHWEVGFAADVLEWYAEEARRIYGRLLPTGDPAVRRTVSKQPVGVVAGFAPWNVPVVLTGNKIAAALATGCSIIVKPAEETPGAILAYVQVLHDAGVPPGVVNAVFGVPAQVSEYLLKSPIVRKLSFTGSTAVGKRLAELAAPGLKRVTLELGGHAPVIVFDDADIDQAVDMLAMFKFFNAGQVCFAPTRFIVHDAVHDRFVGAFAERARTLKVGPGNDPDSQMGPLANARRRVALTEMIEDAVGRGALLSHSYEHPREKGNWFTPTILTDVPRDARIMCEEPFGPVALTTRFTEFEDAIEFANQTEYGLSAFVFTRSARTAFRASEALDCGLVGINNCLVASPDAPFGGVKDSGYGHDYGHEGLEGFLTTKFVNHLAV